jgi:drug/metabolite transporter (DMT)-like permease
MCALCFRIVGGSGTRWLPGDGWSALAGVALGIDFLLFNHGVRLTTAAVAGLLVNFGRYRTCSSRERCWARS